MTEKKKPFNEGLAGLAKVKEQLAKDAERKEHEKKAAEAAAKERAKPRSQDDEEDMFRRAMTGVRRIEPDGKGEVVRQPPIEALKKRAAEDDFEALVDLASAIDSDLAVGVDAAAAKGLDARIVKRLAAGGFPIDAQLDLHGLRKHEAEKKLESFIKTSRASKLRTVMVITGKGTHSDPGGPVLKDAAYALLTKGALAKHVLALSPALKEHGGDGAMYVLLRRR